MYGEVGTIDRARTNFKRGKYNLFEIQDLNNCTRLELFKNLIDSNIKVFYRFYTDWIRIPRETLEEIASTDEDWPILEVRLKGKLKPAIKKKQIEINVFYRGFVNFPDSKGMGVNTEIDTMINGLHELYLSKREEQIYLRSKPKVGLMLCMEK